MVVAIQIWLRLRASIPPSLRKYYSLIIDPAAGQVTVVARMPTLSSPGQWIVSKSDADKNFLRQKPTGSFPWPLAIIDAVRKITLRSHRRARDHGTTRLASVIATRITASHGMPFELLMQSMSQAEQLGDRTGGVTFAITRSKLLRRPWMSVIENCKLSIRVPDEIEDNQQEEVRFTVQSDMKASDSTPLMMTWAHFVWVCLALDVDAYDPLWHSDVLQTIKDGEGKDFIKLFEENDRLYARLLSRQEVTYVTHRALAWYNIAFNGEVLFPLGCGTSSQLPISSVHISSELSAPASLQEGAQTLDSAVCGKEPQGCEHPLAAACYWMLYRRDLPAGWITVSQQMLEYRQRILCHLKDLDDRNLLLDKLVSIVAPNPCRNVAKGTDDEKDTVSHPDTTAEPKQLDVSEMSEQPHADSINPGSHALQVSDDKEEAATSGSTCPTNDNTSNTDRSPGSETTTAQIDGRAKTSASARLRFRSKMDVPIFGENGVLGFDPEVTQHGDFNIAKANRIVAVLRLTFATSAYVQKYSVLTQMVNKSQTPKNRAKNESEVEVTAITADDLAEWARSLLQPLEQREYTHFDHLRKRMLPGTYDLIDPKLRERFEFTVRPYIISPTGCGFEWGNEHNEGDFLACVALALSDWTDCKHQHWTPRPDLDSLAQECESLARAVAARDVAGSLPKLSITLRKGIRSRIRRLLTNVRDDGLYTAPESPVRKLMRELDRNVYLL
jgi:hypothetical protein